MNYRKDVYAYFDRRPGGIIGVAAYKPTDFWHIIEDYLVKQEALDKRYGFGQLVELVDDDMAARFDSALTKLWIAIRRCKDDKGVYPELQQRVEICKRGLDAMEKYVKDHNLDTMPTVWTSTRADGSLVGFVESDDHVKVTKKIRPELFAVWSVREVMLLIDDHKKTSEVKSRLDTAKVVSITNQETDEEYFDEPIPF